MKKEGLHFVCIVTSFLNHFILFTKDNAPYNRDYGFGPVWELLNSIYSFPFHFIKLFYSFYSMSPCLPSSY